MNNLSGSDYTIFGGIKRYAARPRPKTILLSHFKKKFLNLWTHNQEKIIPNVNYKTKTR